MRRFDRLIEKWSMFEDLEVRVCVAMGLKNPSLISSLRVFLSPLIVLLLLHQTLLTAIFAAVVFCLSAWSDHLDGIVARKLGRITTFGKIYDTAADKFLTMPILWIFRLSGLGWAFLIYLTSYEIVSIYLKAHNTLHSRPNQAVIYGKIKFILQIIGIGFIFIELFSSCDLSFLVDSAIYASGILAMISLIGQLWPGSVPFTGESKTFADCWIYMHENQPVTKSIKALWNWLGRLLGRWIEPNYITLARIAILPFLLKAFDHNSHHVVFWLFVSAALSDWIDGWIARNKEIRTQKDQYNRNVGKIIDGVADDLLSLTIFAVVFTSLGWFGIPILTIEFGYSCVAVYAMYYVWKNNLGHIQPNIFGKAHFVVQICAFTLFLAVKAYPVQAEAIHRLILRSVGDVSLITVANVLLAIGAGLAIWSFRIQAYEFLKKKKSIKKQPRTSG